MIPLKKKIIVDLNSQMKNPLNGPSDSLDIDESIQFSDEEANPNLNKSKEDLVLNFSQENHSPKSEKRGKLSNAHLLKKQKF